MGITGITRRTSLEKRHPDSFQLPCVTGAEVDVSFEGHIGDEEFRGKLPNVLGNDCGSFTNGVYQMRF